MKKNQILFAKDGRTIGNAIITKILGDDNFVIKTDYGNKLTMTKKEIETLFHSPSETCSYLYSKSHKNYKN